MGTATEYVGRFLPPYEQVRKAISVVLFTVLFSTFFVVPLYTLSIAQDDRSYTILDDLSNIVGTQTTPPPLVPLYYTFFAFAILGTLVQMAVAFEWEVVAGYVNANWPMFIAALVAAVAADQVAIHVQRNTRPDQFIDATNGGLAYVALAIPAIGLCTDAYGASLSAR